MSRSFVAFDDVRDRLEEALKTADLPEDKPTIYVVRNMFGKIGLSVSEEFRSDSLEKALNGLAQTLHDRLGKYGRPVERAVLWVHPELLDTLDGTAQEIVPGVFLADRLIGGGGWWTVGKDKDEASIRYTLFSIKGGVGRSTTAAVLAWHLARRGEDVLVVDLDLESPGLASALLEPKVQPDFGVVDWFVEELVGQGELLVDQMVGKPEWTRDLDGTVWLAPSHGRNPGEYLAKLGRVYMDTAADPWTVRLQRLLTTLETRLKPKVVILESRSGLHDIGAASVTDVGAKVLLFAVDSPATWTGYEILFEHWRRLGLARDIRERLSIVSALTPELGTERYLVRFRDNAWNLFRDKLYDTLSGTDSSSDAVSYGFEDEDAPHAPLVIYWNRGLAAGTLLRRLEKSTVVQAYQLFLQRFDRQHLARPIETTPAIVPGQESVASKAENVRIALSELPEGTSHGEVPLPSQLYLPPSHRKALDPDVSLITGIRGSGKTFWWGALKDISIRKLLEKFDSRLAPTAKSEVWAGFGVTEAPNDYPGRDEIKEMIGRVEPRIIWRTIHARHLAEKSHPLTRLGSWVARAEYAKNNPEKITRLFREYDDRLDKQKKYSLVLFDGLDRSADNWSDMFKLIRGLLQHALEMRSYRRLRAKVFLRSDQSDETQVATFADASKIFSSSIQLTWPRQALYGLLWQYLGNSRKHGDALRRLLADGEWPVVEGKKKIYTVPQAAY